MKKLSLLLALILCLCSVGCDKATDGTTDIGVSTAPVTENTAESVLETSNEPTSEPLKEISADEALRVLVDAVSERGVDYPLFCTTNRARIIDGIECYEIQLCTESSQDLYDENGEAYKLYYTYGWFAVDRYTGEVYEQTADMEHLAEFSKAPTDPPFDVTAADDYDYICEMAQTDARFKWVKAFIEKDKLTCANMQRYDEEDWNDRERSYEEWYGWMDLVEFGGYSVEIETETYGENTYDHVIFSFDIKESDYRPLPVGQYTYRLDFDGLYYSVYWNRINNVTPTYGDWMPSNRHWIYTHIWTLDPESEYWRWADEGIFAMIWFSEKGREYISPEETEALAEAMFGLEGYVPIRAFAVDGGYSFMGGGGTHVHHEIVRVDSTDTKNEVYVQFYADWMKMVGSYYIKYTFEKTEGISSFKLSSVEILDEGVGSPYAWAT